MGEHYPKSAIGENVAAWCEACKRITDHIIVQHSEHAGRLGHCVDPQHPKKMYTKGQEERMKKKEQERKNPRLF